MFLDDGSTVFPETMISRDINSVYLSTMVMGDSLFAFWRESNPVYYAIRSLDDGSEITPATHLFTTYTNYPHIRACPDSLGRLHVLYNEGSDVIYAVWAPAPGSGFTTEYEWQVDGAHAGGVLLVDGNRVHLVVQDSVYHTLEYLQYDLEGNTVIPQTDFTSNDIDCSRFPELAIDTYSDLLVVDRIDGSGVGPCYTLWKLSAISGETIIDEKTLVIEEIPEMGVSGSFILRPLPGSEEFYLCWTNGYSRNKVFNLLMDLDGNILVDWHTVYDYSDEDPEDVKAIDGVVDDDGNLFIVFNQVETEPILGGYPTFGWFDHTWLGIEDEPTLVEPSMILSSNPFTDFLSIELTGSPQVLELLVYDITGRQVISLGSIDRNVFLWDGSDGEGNQLPSGAYVIRAETQGSISTAKIVKL